MNKYIERVTRPANMSDRCKVLSINVDMFGDMDGLRFFKICKKRQERKSGGRRRDADFRKK